MCSCSRAFAAASAASASACAAAAAALAASAFAFALAFAAATAAASASPSSATAAPPAATAACAVWSVGAAGGGKGPRVGWAGVNTVRPEGVNTVRPEDGASGAMRGGVVDCAVVCGAEACTEADSACGGDRGEGGSPPRLTGGERGEGSPRASDSDCTGACRSCCGTCCCCGGGWRWALGTALAPCWRMLSRSGDGTSGDHSRAACGAGRGMAAADGRGGGACCPGGGGRCPGIGIGCCPGGGGRWYCCW